MNLSYLQGCRPFEPDDRSDSINVGKADLPLDRTVQERRIAFGFQGGDSGEAVARKKGYLRDAHRHWPFLSIFDLSTIRSDVQLSRMIEDRFRVPLTEATLAVRAWMGGKQF